MNTRIINTSPSSIIATINSGDVEASIKLCRNLIEQCLYYSVNTEYEVQKDEPIDTVISFMVAAQFIKETDPSLVGVWRNRLTQAKKYPYCISSNDDKNKKLFERIIPELVSSAIDLAAYGQVLLKFRLLKNNENGEVVKIESLKVPNFCYARRPNKNYRIDANSEWYKENHKPDDIYIYFQDDDFFTGGVMRSLLLLSLAKQSNLSNWFEGNNNLFGAIIAPYDYEKMEDIAKERLRNSGQNLNQLTPEQVSEPAEKALKGLVSLGRAAFPDAIKVEMQKLVDSKIGDSFDKFIQKVDEIMEIAVTGTSGVLRQEGTGSYAKAKVQYLVGDAIRWSDMDNIEALAKLCIEMILPKLTSTTKPEDMAFAWILDEEIDTTSFLNNLETALSLNLKTKDNKPFAITVGSLYKNGNFEMPDGMNADEVFYSDSRMADDYLSEPRFSGLND
jgi:hypothetical protein